jgi:hypothetical protein
MLERGTPGDNPLPEVVPRRRMAYPGRAPGILREAGRDSMHVRRLLCLVLLTVSMSACGGTVNPTGPVEPDMSPSGRSAMEKELDRNLEKWASTRLEDYDYQINKICFCQYPVLYPVTVSVRNGERSRAISSDDLLVGEEVPILTIEELIELARRAIQESSRVQIYYDSAKGYPTRVSIGKWPGNEAGENTSYTVTLME